VTPEQEEATAVQLAQLGTHLTAEEWVSWLRSPPDVQKRVIDTLVLSAEPPPTDYWGDVLKVLLLTAEVFGAVAGIVSGAQLVKGVIP
jgi:hypothetical protein